MELAALKDSLHRFAPNAIPTAEPGRVPSALPTGADALDQSLIGGGFPTGQLTELAGSSSSGKTALLLAAAAEQTKAGKLVAYLDGRAQLYPPAAAALGVDLKHLLVVSFHSRDRLAIDIARAADIVARSRSFPLIIVDLPDGTELQPQRAQRLKTTANATGTAVVVLTTKTGTVANAAVRMHLVAKSHSRGRSVFANIHKGGNGPGVISTEVQLSGVRIDHVLPLVAADIANRVAPGTEATPPERVRRGGRR